MLNSHHYNPDVLTCLANLSSDEIFTPPQLVNQMLDLLPKNLWSDKTATFLDPGCKSGVFLREITKRLDDGLAVEIPDRQKRINHILKNQVFGLAITEMTSLLSRRSAYCSKHANGQYSVCNTFDDQAGNIQFKQVAHKWNSGRCSYCGASQSEYERGLELETHAYQFIHTDNPEDIFKMKFDVIIGNPPYQLSDAGDSTGSSPIYQKFVDQAKKMNPRYLTMIIPSRWFAGGKGLDGFRDAMLHDKRISHLTDYPIAADVFPGVKIIGGVCYFLWERDYSGPCSVTTNMSDLSDTMVRQMDEFDTFVRFNKAISILKKVSSKKYPSLSSQVSRQKPFGLRTFITPNKIGNITLYANKNVGLFDIAEITAGKEMIEKWKVLISMGYGEGGEAKEYPRMIMGKPIIAAPPSACTETYIVIGSYNTEAEAINLANYLRSRFLRFLVGLRKNTQHITKDRFAFVPALSMAEMWSDKILYKHFGLEESEITFIESMIRPMEENNA